jgi:hypothetical protein
MRSLATLLALSGLAAASFEPAMLERHFSIGLGTPHGGYRNRAGWSNRRYQRAAAKRRNQKRHPRGCA